MNVLVFGANGQLGRALQSKDGVTALNRQQADLLNPELCKRIIEKTTADAIINAAAYTGVDAAETDRDTAYAINAIAPAAIATAAAARDIPFLTVSTDYVFCGDGDTPWKPDAPTAPINIYGASKAAGEKAVRAMGGRHVILRTSWVFSSHGNNFVKTMLQLSETRDTLSIVGDQIGGPTAAHDIADCLLSMAAQMTEGATGGTYHFSGKPDVSWADFANEVFRQTGREIQVTPIPTSDYPTPAARPRNSRLDCGSLYADFGISRPDWRKSLSHVLTDLGER
ncbi:dTDP-4-dehydrorhamnose reductase [Yoonia litorea]|uniref:dTDP-4-dehydrorhamnose reductase n=1 Tax=Yoonia litorea TaxID=1123755 RepID=A0A1I6MVC3_9RHOB|nr:dTDP-4-dehydrorhamnose reductase [Yoonia litorea]SFS19561.1 dTDP-4-dehydrorhamnose reductase [Yoonia litorea]